MSKKISELPALPGAAGGTDLTALVQAGTTYKMTLAVLAAYIETTLTGLGGEELHGLRFTSDTGSTADSDPGAGLFKWNNGTQASATALYFDAATIDAVSTTTFFGSLSTQGFIYLQQKDDGERWQLWKWGAAPTSATGYYKFTSLTLQAASANPIQDDKEVFASFSPLAAAATGDVVGPGSSVDNTLSRFDGVTGKLLQTSGIVVSDTDELHGYLAKLNLQTGTTYTVDTASPGDRGKVIDHSNASAISVTLPATAPAGFACTYVQGGAGQITFASTGSGSVVNRQSHTKTAALNAVVALYVRSNAGGSAAVWVLAGDTAA